ncbi:uncharacterized protein [Leuresthes tenuis]|uniref:uncharacterized protein n=1 Tax=Leuresthes tenuis TaxID=355514 RepID=UPI003B5119FA
MKKKKQPAPMDLFIRAERTKRYSDTVRHTMRIFILITALFLCSLSWICESHTVEVQSGEDVTLLCSNISTSSTQTDWFRVVNRTKPSCIASTFGAHGEASFCDGFQGGKFEMSSNITTVFLKIKRVDFSDSGLYFCGFYMTRHIVLVSATELMVRETSCESTNLLSVILGGLTVFLIVVIIGLVVQIKKLQKAQTDKQNPQHSEMPSNALNYAAVGFRPKEERSRRAVQDRELAQHVVYAATR